MDTTRGLAIVSGAGSGLGRDIALALARRGHPLALFGRRVERLRTVAGESGAQPGYAAAWSCDVRDESSVGRAVEEAIARFGPPEVVVPAAGTAHVAALESTSAADFDAVVETNLRGVFLLARACLPAMRSRERSWLIAVLSVAARRGFPGWSAYCASKWGLAGLLAALREETAGSGVTVTGLYPGAVETPLWDVLPGTWNRATMLPAAELARAVEYVLEAPPSAKIEEILISPAAGNQ